MYYPYYLYDNTLQALELTPFFSAKKHAKTHSEDHMYMHSWSFHYYIDVMDTSIRDVFLGIAALTRQPDVSEHLESVMKKKIFFSNTGSRSAPK